MQLSPFTDPPLIAQRGLLDKEAAFERLAQALASERMTILVLAVALAIALLAPLGPLTSNRFHRDEAIYSLFI